MGKKTLVIPRKILTQHGFIPTDTKGGYHYTILQEEMLEDFFVIAKKSGELKERYGDDGVEEDPSLQQAIIYAYFVRPDGKIFLYQRGDQEGSETRLARKVSIGIGGHMESHDQDLIAAFYREFVEEVHIYLDGKEIPDKKLADIEYVKSLIDLDLRGILKDERDAVGMVHIGLVCRLMPLQDTIHIEVRSDTKENLRSQFVSKEEFERMEKDGIIEPEGWTEIVFRHEL